MREKQFYAVKWLNYKIIITIGKLLCDFSKEVLMYIYLLGLIYLYIYIQIFTTSFWSYLTVKILNLSKKIIHENTDAFENSVFVLFRGHKIPYGNSLKGMWTASFHFEKIISRCILLYRKWENEKIKNKMRKFIRNTNYT